MPNQFSAPTHFAIVRENAGAVAGTRFRLKDGEIAMKILER
jgi:hypothetical protein